LILFEIFICCSTTSTTLQKFKFLTKLLVLMKIVRRFTIIIGIFLFE
jgi:hypothetical protein